ncbi:hypothetical protein RhiJN_01245 [Ceratobasidium sp. AG-Ba]|nr:hypothetical protein RhiJN_01245 [Ceratobasidium sp. AG-Ba]QRW02278.1 hypothetical protein RhiLY_01275 [Ceratobasidium sp. AG-Ba]
MPATVALPDAYLTTCSSLVKSFAGWDLSRSSPKHLELPNLPGEIQREIVRVYVDQVVSTQHTVWQLRFGDCLTKRNRALLPLMLACHHFHEWVCDDWAFYWRAPISGGGAVLPGNVRPVLAQYSVYFGPELLRSPVDLPWYEGLRFASLGLEGIFERTNGVWASCVPAVTLPPLLQELHLWRYHAPDHVVIDLVRAGCPNLRALYLGPCTMFTNPRCDWWPRHPLRDQHEHYLPGHDPAAVVAYAKRLANLLRSWPNLKTLVLGVHFTTFDIVEAHRADHVAHHPQGFDDARTWLEHLGVQNNNLVEYGARWHAHPTYGRLNILPPNPDLPCPPSTGLWRTPCPQCVKLWSRSVKLAHITAVQTLALGLESLQAIWLGSFAPGGQLCPRKHEIYRLSMPPSPNGETRVRVGVDCPGVYGLSSKVFRRAESEWLEDESDFPGHFVV